MFRAEEGNVIPLRHSWSSPQAGPQPGKMDAKEDPGTWLIPPVSSSPNAPQNSSKSEPQLTQAASKCQTDEGQDISNAWFSFGSKPKSFELEN